MRLRIVESIGLHDTTNQLRVSPQYLVEKFGILDVVAAAWLHTVAGWVVK